jgi:hypothetical protein
VKNIILAFLLCLPAARGGDDFDKAFAKPTPTPAPRASNYAEVHWLTGQIVKRIADEAYLVRPDAGCAAQMGLLLVAVSGSSASGGGFVSELIFVKGEPEMSGSSVATLVQHDGRIEMEADGRLQRVKAYKVVSVDAAPSKLQKIFGSDTKMQGSVLDQPVH